MGKQFTVKTVEALKPKPKSKGYYVREGRGFAVRVYPGGEKSFCFIYHFRGQKKLMTFGRYPDLSLADARDLHRAALSTLALGKDPGAKQTVTVLDLASEFMEKWSKPRKRTWREDERNINRYILPRLGSQLISEVSRREVREMVEAIKEKGLSGRPAPTHANRIFALTRRMFNFAIEVDLLEVSPCDHIKAPSPETQRDRMLSEAETKVLLNTLPNLRRMTDGTRRALLLILITAQRPGEIAAMDWSEIEGRWWTIPAAKVKNKKPHRVWLSDLALETLPPRRKAGPVFPSPDGKADSMGANVMARAMGRWREDPDWPKSLKPFTPHDLRRSAASGMTGMGTPRLVVSKILNHADPSVTAIYDRSSYDNEKRQALERWSRHLVALRDGKQDKEGAEVIPIR